jgi:HlyD family secretion protein
LKRTLLLLLLPVAALAIWVFQKKSDLPRVAFAKPLRESVSNTISTNGKVEPIQYVVVRVEAPGLVKKVFVHQGDAVRADEVLAELSQTGTTEELEAAQARVSQARADLQTLRAGGRSSDLADLDTSLSRLKEQRNAAQRNLDSLERLLQANAATRFEVEQARQALADLDVQIRSAGQRRGALVGTGDLQAAQARLREAEASVSLAKAHLGQSTVRTPIGGVVYDLPAREGAYLNVGDAVGSVGKLDPVRVRVYVDEPELGRVAPGEPVRITWDAIPGKDWTGTVEKRPSEVIALGSRQVGEVLCTVANPNRDLIPGTNVNAFILTQVVQDALTIPKAAVRRDNGIGVYVLQKNDTLAWRKIETGIGDALRIQVVSGLSEGDMVAQPSDQTLKEGEKVTPSSR